MKIECHCGARIIDQTDDLPHKAYLIPDQEWFAVLDAIDRAGSSGPDQDAARREARSILWRVSRLAWQCGACGRLYVDDQDDRLREFVPAEADSPKEIFRSRPDPADDG